MQNFQVTISDDIVDPNDGELSLREAVDLANESDGRDTISFAPSLIESEDSTIMLTEGYLELTDAVSISGDVDNDGISDISINAADHHHFTVASGVQVTLTGLDLVGGQPDFNGGGAAHGENGTRGVDQPTGYGQQDADVATQDQNGGVAGEDGLDGGRGGSGGSGDDGLEQAASIQNYGELTLERVGFGNNSGFAQNGGNGARGGDGGFGGQGGEGFQGNSANFVGGQQTQGRWGNGVIDGGAGGDGGNGGEGGSGGDGGDGGSTAGAILNGDGAQLTLTDVVFGGTLTGGTIYDGNSAFGGDGGRPGSGGFGGSGGVGGDGGDAGVELHFSEPVFPDDGEFLSGSVGTPGDGGLGGDAGRGGSAGSYGDAGSAAGAILNFGSIDGEAAFFGNSATAGTPRPENPNDLTFGGNLPGQPGTGGSSGDNNGYNAGSGNVVIGPIGSDGSDGAGASSGDNNKQGGSGAQSDDVLNARSGSGSIDQNSILVYAHGVNTEGNDDTANGSVSFNIIRVGDSLGDVIVDWELRPGSQSPVNGKDFVGAGLPGGQITLDEAGAGSSQHNSASQLIEIALNQDGVEEGVEDFEFVITGARLATGGNVLLGTSSVSGQISDSGTSLATEGDDVLTGTQEPDTIDGLAGSDTIAGKDGADTLDGGKGGDEISGDKGNDSVSGRKGNDTLTGNAGDDTVRGGDGNDMAKGAKGNDSVSGGDGKDNIQGGDGNDTLSGDNQDDDLSGGKGDDTVSGGKGADVVAGDNGRDDLSGDEGADLIDGGGGKDTLGGGKGADTLNGGEGNDTIKGGGGSDTFVFGTGKDRVKDFDADDNAEKVDLSGVSAIKGFNDLQNNHMSQVGDDVEIDDLSGNVMVLASTVLDDLQKVDFIF